MDEVVPGDALQERCREMAAQIIANSPLSIAMAKRVLDRGALADLETALAMETDALVSTYFSDDVEAGIRAFAARGEEKGS